jgi:hypothetical protein
MLLCVLQAAAAVCQNQKKADRKHRVQHGVIITPGQGRVGGWAARRDGRSHRKKGGSCVARAANARASQCGAAPTRDKSSIMAAAIQPPLGASCALLLIEQSQTVSLLQSQQCRCPSCKIPSFSVATRKPVASHVCHRTLFPVYIRH